MIAPGLRGGEQTVNFFRRHPPRKTKCELLFFSLHIKKNMVKYNTGIVRQSGLPQTKKTAFA
jgi:hypothetical protein